MATEIHGHCDPRFARVEEAFRANFDEGMELGASLAVTLHGKPVVDLWAGHADLNRKLPWDRDTIVLVFSSTKLAPILMTLMLIDRGLLELDAPIARYWPAFAQGGKQHVTVRDALTHQAGVPGLAEALPFEAMRDWQLVTKRIAAEPHWFDGERVLCYHLITVGFILGELIRIVTGLSPSDFFRLEVAEPLRADFQIGLRSRADEVRVARLAAADQDLSFEPGSLTDRTRSSFGVGGWWQHRAADIPAVNGYTNARALARVGSIFACRGELDGRRFLSAALVDEARKEQVFAQEDTFGPLRLGLGFGLHCQTFPAPTPSCFHWGGYGGSLFAMDVDTGVSCGYAANKLMVDDEVLGPRSLRLWEALGTDMNDLPRSSPNAT